jgi:hypothetical protein
MLTDVEEISQPEADGFSVAETIKSIPGSAARYVGGIAEAVTHPIQTAEELTKLAVGGVQTLLPEPEEKTIVSPQGRTIRLSGKEHKQSWQNFSNAMQQRYGGWDNVKNTIQTDPVGFLADVSAVLIPTGGAVGAAGRAIEPINMARKVIGAAGKKISPAIQKKLYISALKMQTSQKVSVAERTRRARTGVEKGIQPTSGGLKKLNNEIRRTDLRVQKVINRGTRKGDMVAIDDILKPTAKIKEKAKHSMDRESVLRSIDDLESELRSHPDIVNGKIPAKAANEIKKRAWADLDGKFGEAKALEVEARKAVGFGAMDELEKLYPEIRKLNKESGAMRGLRQSVEQSVKRLENNNVISLSDWIVMTGGGAAAGVPGGAGAVALKKIMSSPKVKAATSFALKKAGKIKIPEVAIPAQIGARAGALVERPEEIIEPTPLPRNIKQVNGGGI